MNNFHMDIILGNFNNYILKSLKNKIKYNINSLNLILYILLKYDNKYKEYLKRICSKYQNKAFYYIFGKFFLYRESKKLSNKEKEKHFYEFIEENIIENNKESYKYILEYKDLNLKPLIFTLDSSQLNKNEKFIPIELKKEIKKILRKIEIDDILYNPNYIYQLTDEEINNKFSQEDLIYHFGMTGIDLKKQNCLLTKKEMMLNFFHPSISNKIVDILGIKKHNNTFYSKKLSSDVINIFSYFKDYDELYIIYDDIKISIIFKDYNINKQKILYRKTEDWGFRLFKPLIELISIKRDENVLNFLTRHIKSYINSLRQEAIKRKNLENILKYRKFLSVSDNNLKNILEKNSKKIVIKYNLFEFKENFLEWFIKFINKEDLNYVKHN